jgi:hypothetical protein
MAKIRSIEEIAEKYARVTPQRSADYEAGIKTPKVDWRAETEASADRWAQGIQQAIGNKSFEKGVRRVGTEKWQKKALELGVTRWGPGVSAAKGDYAQGFAPYAQEIASVQLPPRGARGDPRNLERVAKIAMALHARKLRG